MFMGEYAHNIDRKGRLIMPAKFREDLGEHVVVNRGLDGCLYVYTAKQWEQYIKSYRRCINKQRCAYVSAYDVVESSGGRSWTVRDEILIPRTLIELAGLEKECLIVGMANHVEIWSKERWMQLEEEQSGSFEEAAEALNGFME